MTSLDILKAARELLSDRAHWTKLKMARDKDGYGTFPEAEEATCWCCLGALSKCSPEDGLNEKWGAEAALAKATGGLEVATFNDLNSTGHSDVLGAFDKAIESLTASA